MTKEIVLKNLRTLIEESYISRKEIKRESRKNNL